MKEKIHWLRNGWWENDASISGQHSSKYQICTEQLRAGRGVNVSHDHLGDDGDGREILWRDRCCLKSWITGGLYFAKTDSAKSEIQYRNVVNRTLPNQEYAKPESAKTYSGIC